MDRQRVKGQGHALENGSGSQEAGALRWAPMDWTATKAKWTQRHKALVRVLLASATVGWAPADDSILSFSWSQRPWSEAMRFFLLCASQPFGWGPPKLCGLEASVDSHMPSC